MHEALGSVPQYYRNLDIVVHVTLPFSMWREEAQKLKS